MVSGSKKLKRIFSAFIIIYLIIGSFAYGSHSYKNVTYNTEIDEPREFIFSGVVQDYITNAPLNDVNIKCQVEWLFSAYDKIQSYYEEKTNPPLPYITQTLEEMNTSGDGKYYIESSILKPRGDKIFYYLRFSKPGYFNESIRFCDTGEAVMAHTSTVLLCPCIKLTGKVTSASGEPLDNTLVIAVPTRSTIAPFPKPEYLTTSENGLFEFTNMKPDTNYDLIFGCSGHETRMVKNVTLLGRLNNTVYTSLMPINSLGDITVNGSILINEICTKYYLNEMDFFIWLYRAKGNIIHVININSEGKFSIKLPEGYYYFVPFEVPHDEKLAWEFSYQLIEIYNYLEIEFRGTK